MKKAIIAIGLLWFATTNAATADKSFYTNLFCHTPEIRGSLYQTYVKQRDGFEDELATKIASGECIWKGYSSDTELTFLYQFNDTEVMISAVLDGVTMYAVTYNEYIK